MPTGNSLLRHGQLSEDAEDLRAWLRSLGHQDVQIRVIRKSPKTYTNGSNAAGLVQTYTEPVSEEVIREEHGGGEYQVVIHYADPEGRMKFLNQRTIRIAGPPKLDGQIPVSEPGDVRVPAVDNGLASQAMDTMKYTMNRALEKADRAERQSGFDPQMFSALQAPLVAQIEAIQQQITAKDAQILGLLTRKAEDPGGDFRDKILEKMVDGESARIETLRAQHDSELRQLRENYKHDLDRVHDAAKDELKTRERQHERELDAMKEANRVASSAIGSGYETRVDGLKSEIARLTGEVAALKIELAEQKARKEKTLTEQATEIIKVQEAFKELGVGGKDDEDEKKPWYEKAAIGLMENPDAIGQLIGGVRQNIAPPAAAPTPQLPPPGQPFQGPDGKVYVMRSDGRAHRLGAGVAPAARKKAAAAKAAAESKDRAPEPTEIALAISFMESAVSNHTAPEVFAQSARSAIPGDILAYIEKTGVDEFLNSAQLDAGSSLRTQAGRNWSRTVARILLEGA